jgi:undecaprenyl-diphosphatase
MELARAALLGAMQGATEFLPVSSSGHLVLVPALLGWGIPGLAFDAAVHMATGLAVLLRQRDSWVAMLRGAAGPLRRRDAHAPDGRQDRRLLVLLALGTAPAAVAGALLERHLEPLFADPLLAAGMLIVTALVLVASERLGRGDRSLRALDGGRALWVGLAQAVAIVPGLSRSGSTIAAAQLSGLDRLSATRFSFLLAAPILLGAGAFEMARFARETPPADAWGAIAAGSVAAFVVGWLASGWMLALVARRSLLPFALYTAGAGILGLVILG